MKIIHIILLFPLAICNGQTIQPVEKITADNIGITTDKSDQIDKSKFYTTQDTIIIFADKYETIKYSKEEFNAVVDNHPELYDYTNYWIKNPDETYLLSKHNDFGGETGQDQYYILYAYFLKQSNGINEYAKRRQKLMDIFEDINYIYCQLRNGGTYFGHQSYRIIGYVEYNIYESKDNKLQEYDIAKQKNLYVQSLRQLIEDEKDFDNWLEDHEKAKKFKDLNKVVNRIEKNITDIFYLRKAQEFQYSYYSYYWD